MRKFLYTLLVVFCATSMLNAQEFISTVKIDAQQTGQQNLQIFKTLEQQLTELVNNNSWTNETYLIQERIQVSFNIIISSFTSNNFRGTLQVQAVRPVYGSSYLSPIYNINDRQVAFEYAEFENLEFNINTYSSNIVSILAFHLYSILGVDGDTFELNGGEKYHNTAKQIVNTASSSNYPGWKSSDGTQTRYSLNDAMVSPVYSEFHEALYLYHRQGLDMMHRDTKRAKENIIAAIEKLRAANDVRPNSYLLRTFFDAKGEEIKAVFNDGPKVDITKLVDNLNRIAPTKRKDWAEIRF